MHPPFSPELVQPLDLGLNFGYLSGAGGGEAPFCDWATRVKDWLIVDSNGQFTQQPCPRVLGPRQTVGRDWPDFSVQGLRHPNAAAWGRVMNATTGALLPPKPTTGAQHWILCWRGNGSVKVTSTAAGAVSEVDPITGSKTVTFRFSPSAQKPLKPSPRSEQYQMRGWLVDDNAVNQGRALDIVIEQGDPSGADPVRDVYLWQPQTLVVSGNGTVIGGRTVRPEFVDDVMKMNGGAGPVFVRGIHLERITEYGVTGTVDMFVHTLANQPKLKSAAPEAHGGVHPALMVAIANEVAARQSNAPGAKCDLWTLVPVQSLHKASKALAAADLFFGNIPGQPGFAGTNVPSTASGTITVSGGGGTGASFSYVASGNKITSIALVAGGSGYKENETLRCHVNAVDGNGDPFECDAQVVALVRFTSEAYQLSDKQLSDADYETFVRRKVQAIKNGNYSVDSAQHGTLYNFGQPMAGLHPDSSLIGELGLECWNSIFVMKAILEALDAGNNYDTTYGDQVERILPWLKNELTGGAIGDVDRMKVYVGGTNSITSYLSNALAAIPTTNRIDLAGPQAYIGPLQADIAKWNTAISGGLKGITISNGGTNYTSDPTVVIGPPAPGGRQAVATASRTANVVTGITITDAGSLYDSLNPPAASVTGGGGTGCVLVVNANQVGTGDATDPDFPTDAAVITSARSNLAALKTALDTNATTVNNRSGQPGGAPELCNYEIGTSFVAGFNPWAPWSLSSQLAQEITELYLNPVSGAGGGLFKTLRVAGYLMSGVFCHITPFASNGISTFFGHERFLGTKVPDLVPYPVPTVAAGEEPNYKWQCVCRGTRGAERQP